MFGVLPKKCHKFFQKQGYQWKGLEPRIPKIPKLEEDQHFGPKILAFFRFAICKDQKNAQNGQKEWSKTKMFYTKLFQNLSKCRFGL